MKSVRFILPLLLISLLVISVDAMHYFEIDIRYDHGNLSYGAIRVIPSQTELSAIEGKFIAEVVSYDNDILNLTFFSVPRLIFYDKVDPLGKIVGGGSFERNMSEVRLYVPYYVDAKEINIYDWDLVERLKIDVNDFAKERKVQKEGVLADIEDEPPVISAEKKVAEPLPSGALAVLISLGIILTLVIIITVLKRRKS